MQKDIILIVDDNELQRDLFAEALEASCTNIIAAENGVEALSMIDKYLDSLAVVLLDINMPLMNGIEVLDNLSERGILKKLPVIMVSAEEDAQSINSCFKYQIADFIAKKIDFHVIQKRVENIIALYLLKHNLEETVAAQTEELRQTAEHLAAINESTIELLGNVVEARNQESGLHVKRVKQYTKMMAEEYAALYPEAGLTEHKIALIASGSVLHDVGKIMIPDNILLKPGKLTDEEFAIMKSHSEAGFKLLEQVKGLWNDEYGQVCKEIARYHHERTDGRGYPLGLKGDEIPLSAQFAAMADVYDALVSDRCYRKAFDKDTAYNMIINGKCGAFSDRMLQCFTNMINKLSQ